MSVHPHQFGLFPYHARVMIRQSIVWRYFLRQWPFFNCGWLARNSRSEIQTGAPVCSGFPRDKSTVHMHARPGLSRRPRPRITHNALIIQHRSIRGSGFTWQCSPFSRLVTVVLLFAQIHGGSKTKQAAPALNGPLHRENADSCTATREEMCRREVVAVETKIISKLRRFWWCGEK